MIIKELSPSLRDDYLRFFDRDAFADNPKWASCYCYFAHAPHSTENWGDRTADQNRAGVCELIASGVMTGYLAYVDDKPVGWCNANLKSRYTILDHSAGDESVGAI